MGQTINNLGNLLRVPYGCAEQNMIGFTPNVYAMRYMKATDQVNSQLANRAIRNMQRGTERFYLFIIKTIIKQG